MWSRTKSTLNKHSSLLSRNGKSNSVGITGVDNRSCGSKKVGDVLVYCSLSMLSYQMPTCHSLYVCCCIIKNVHGLPATQNAFQATSPTAKLAPSGLASVGVRCEGLAVNSRFGTVHMRVSVKNMMINNKYNNNNNNIIYNYYIINYIY